MVTVPAVRGNTVSPTLGAVGVEIATQELSDGGETPVLRAYLRKWKAGVGGFFDGVSAGSEASDCQRMAPNHPVFVLAEVENGDERGR